ncbi:MAG: hypothetical protein AAF658_13830 [Myxococcota bacterium]
MRSTVLALGVFLTSAAALATPARNLTLAELVKGSNLIATGTVQQSAGEWQDGRILTRHEFVLDDVWNGKAKGTVELTTLGGFVGDIGQRVSNQVDLREKERILTFLVWDPLSDSYRIVGASNGVYRIQTSNDGTLRLFGDADSSPGQPPALVELKTRVEELARAR